MTDEKKNTPLMQSNATSFHDPAQIREQAEKKVETISFPDFKTMTREIIQQRFHELHVKQTETELQNEQLRSQLEERNSEVALFKIVTENMLDLVALTDMEGNFIFAGKSHEIMGYEPGFLIGKNVMDFVHPEDLPRILEEFAEFVASGHPRMVEYRNRCRDGTYLWLETMGIFIKDKNGIPQKIVFSSRNITERKQAEDSLKQIEWMLSKKTPPNDAGQTEDCDQGYGDLTELNRDGIILKSIGRARLESFANDYLELLGTSSAIYEVNGDYAFGIFSSGWCRMMDRASRELCNTSDNAAALNSGQWLCHESCWTDCSQEVIAGCTPVDIACNGGIRIYAVPILASGNVVGTINFGYGDPPKDPEKLRKLADLYHIKYDDLVREAYAYDSRPPFIIELVKKRLHAVARIIGSMIETKKAEEALRESEERFQKMLSVVPDMISIHDTDMNIVYSNWNGFGAVPEKKRILQTKCYQTYRGYDDICPDCQAKMVFETRKPFQTEEQLPEGVWIDLCVIPLLDGNGNVELFVEWIRDITNQKQAEEAQIENKNLVESIIDGTPDILAFQLPDHSIERFNQAGYKLLGLTPKEVKGRKCYELIGRNRMCDDCATRKALETGKLEELENYFPELGLYFHCRSNPVLDKHGKTVQIIQQLRDITKDKAAEKEREKLQAQLNQSQKMESVGRLAGGVAHDFNNKLAIINGYAELAIDMMDPLDPLRKTIQEIFTAGKQSADIVRQLLAFARQQTISPVLLDLNDTIFSMIKMLQRLIGENIDLAWHPGKNLWPVKIDPSQVDQVMTNLAVNARDAITDGGKLTIETKNTIVDEDYCKTNPEAIQGRYVMLAVSDDGHGMKKEVKDQLFEPFFTTKDIGKGTGLGLATIYGIVRQNKGFVSIYSEFGEGTTFKIYLPSQDAENPLFHAAKKSSGDVPMGSETILLVEDEPAILKMGKEMIERLGYTVLTAENPNDAFRVAWEYDGDVDLLITDVIMPELNGRDLSSQLAKNHLGLKTLYMSGYTADVIAHHGVLDEGVQFIQKPFSLKDLAVKVREVIEQEQAS